MSRAAAFASESNLSEFCVEPLVHHLDRDDARKTQILGPIDGRHPATSDLGGDLVATLEDMTH